MRWLTHGLCEGAPRLHHVAAWATPRLHTRQGCRGQPGPPWDVSDDRLATVLEALSDATRWSAGEAALTHHTLRVDDLQPAGVRVARPPAQGHGRVTDAGLFPCGHRPDQRPDRPPVQIRVSAVAPLGMPVATAVVPGQRADAPWSGPAITRVRESLGPRRCASCQSPGYTAHLSPAIMPTHRREC